MEAMFPDIPCNSFQFPTHQWEVLVSLIKEEEDWTEIWVLLIRQQIAWLPDALLWQDLELGNTEALPWRTLQDDFCRGACPSSVQSIRNREFPNLLSMGQRTSDGGSPLSKNSSVDTVCVFESVCMQDSSCIFLYNIWCNLNSDILGDYGLYFWRAVAHP
jgi:hypothetical protein